MKTNSTSSKFVQKNKRSENFLEFFFLICALISIFTTLGIIGVLIFESISFFQEVSVINFFTDTLWTPLFAQKEFGIIVLISATLLTSAIALLLALPVGLLTAVFLSEYASEKMRKILKPALEILAGIPTVVYGYFALFFVTPLLKQLIPSLSGFNSLSAGLVLGVMIIPTIASLSEDAIYAVPRSLREGAYALGATRPEVIRSIILPVALSGIITASILGISRAVGETMIVSIAAGQNPRLTLDPTVPVQTMTSFIVQVSLGDTPTGSLAYQSIFVVGMALFAITISLNFISRWIVKKFREVHN